MNSKIVKVFICCLLTMSLFSPASIAQNENAEDVDSIESVASVEALPHFHIMGNDTELQCIENASLDCTPSTHTYHSCLICGMIEKRGPTFHHRVNHVWSVGWAGQTCTVCGRVEIF